VIQISIYLDKCFHFELYHILAFKGNLVQDLIGLKVVWLDRLSWSPAQHRKNGATQVDPQACWMITPAWPRAAYLPSTLLLPGTQRRSYTIQVWSYETFIVFETVINRYLMVKTWEDLNILLIILLNEHIIIWQLVITYSKNAPLLDNLSMIQNRMIIKCEKMKRNEQ
jgi:hypothetical protein